MKYFQTIKGKKQGDTGGSKFDPVKSKRQIIKPKFLYSEHDGKRKHPLARNSM